MSAGGIRQAVVLCGGRGERLRELLGGRPKVLVPVGERPLLLRLLDDLAAAGLEEALLLAGWGGEQVAAAAREGAPPGLRVRTLVESSPRGSAGALHEAAAALDERFLLVFGDVLTQLDWGRFAAAALANGGLGTLLLHRTDHPQDSDVALVDEDGRLRRWWRRGEGGGAPALGNAGLAVLHRDILRFISRERPSDLFGEVIPPLVEARRPLFGYLTSEYVRDVGTPARLAEVSTALAEGRARRRAALVVLDRDGVLVEEQDLLHDPARLRLLPGAAAGLRLLNEAGIVAALATNQSVVARGLCTAAGLDAVHARLVALLAAEGARLDSLHHCPHHPETHYPEGDASLRGPCRCRKPSPGMVEAALAAHALPPWRAVVIGDRTGDLQLAHNAGLPAIGLDTGAALADGAFPARPTWRFPDLLAAARWLVG